MMPRALILGGYGLIGSACLHALARAGFSVTGMGRDRQAAERLGGDWIIRDLTQVSAAEWQDLLQGFDVVVNAAGALQDGPRDDLRAIHQTMPENLVAGAQGLPLRIVQISAAGAAPDARTAFFRSKALGDAALIAQGEDVVILRPVLVLAPDAYGGTAMLRAAASLPLVQPIILPEAQVQTLHIDDLAAAVVAAARAELPADSIVDLTEPGMQDFPALLTAMRRWLGLPAPLWHLPLPGWALGGVARLADLAGHLGWRSPLRSNAVAALRDGIRGDPGGWAQLGCQPLRGLAQTLADLPATRQERTFARLWLALPIMIVTLSLFWIASGAFALIAPGRAAEVLIANDISPALSRLIVIGGALADLGLGLAILWRGWARRAALGMILLSLAYLGGSLVVAPDLWADPLGPMVKVLPATVLALIPCLLLEER